jgi:predicted nucleic acid-binding protein
MPERPTHILDASVVGKWLLPPSEASSTEAIAIQSDTDRGLISVAAPFHLAYEVPSVITKAVGGGRLTRDDANSQLRLFYRILRRFLLPRTQALSFAAQDMAVRYGCTFYDGLYLALAETFRVPFVHADAKLRRTLAGRIPWEEWISDYRSST